MMQIVHICTVRFYRERVPLIILVFGTSCTSKSLLVTRLGQLMNLPNIVQTEIVFDLVDPPESKTDETFVRYLQDFKTKKDFIEYYEKECILIRHGVDFEIQKCISEGKTLIMEGFQMDPSLFHELIIEGWPGYNGGATGETILGRKGRDSTKKRPVVVPFLLRVENDDHRFFIKDRLSCTSYAWQGTHLDEADPHSRDSQKKADVVTKKRREELLRRFQMIQTHLMQFSDMMHVVHVGPSRTDETLSALHSTVLQTIESAHSLGWF
jgi:hypothetical protein